tara:strand:- start:14314 stop:15060 length:747 start_codon:yes stop_codon:yes gene_type:complete
MKGLRKGLMVACAAATVTTLSGCAAVGTYINHRNVDSESKMSNTVFLDPVPNSEKTIYVQVRNTSSQDFSKFKPDLVANLKASGWKVVDDVSKAHDMIQVNLLQFGKAKNADAVWNSISSGYGNAVAGGMAGVAAGLMSDSVGTGLGVGAVVGVGSWVADKLYSNVMYSSITDVQISVKTDGNVKQVTNSNLSQGSQTNVSQVFEQDSHWLRYRTRVGSLIQKANLTAENAMPVLAKQQANEIAGIFN